MHKKVKCMSKIPAIPFPSSSSFKSSISTSEVLLISLAAHSDLLLGRSSGRRTRVALVFVLLRWKPISGGNRQMNPGWWDSMKLLPSHVWPFADKTKWLEDELKGLWEREGAQQSVCISNISVPTSYKKDIFGRRPQLPDSGRIVASRTNDSKEFMAQHLSSSAAPHGKEGRKEGGKEGDPQPIHFTALQRQFSACRNGLIS